MSRLAGAESARIVAVQAGLARSVVTVLGGRYSAGLGIDVDAGDAEIERWFLAATLFGIRIPAAIAERTFGVLGDAGVLRVATARDLPWDRLVALLDDGGYVRYDARMATRLQNLAEVIGERYGGQAAVIGRLFPAYPGLRDALDLLPGWGPVTIGLFLRELRGVWPGAQPPLAERAAAAARHLALGPDPSRPEPTLAGLASLAAESGLDVRDLESGLVRLALAHRRTLAACPGGRACTVLAGHEGRARAG